MRNAHVRTRPGGLLRAVGWLVAALAAGLAGGCGARSDLRAAIEWPAREVTDGPATPSSRSESVPTSGPPREAPTVCESPGAARKATLIGIPEGVRPRAWRHIVIHHSATDAGSAAAFDRYHRDVRGWQGLGYHFVIGNGRGAPDGELVASKRWLGQCAGAHAGSDTYNESGIGICLVGDFEHARPTVKQMARLREIVETLMERFDIPASNVLRHSDISATKCPGGNFPWPLVAQPSGAAPAEQHGR